MPDFSNQFDKSSLRQAIYDAPKQFSEGFDIAQKIKVDGVFERCVFHGEGGSAFPVSLVKTLLRDIFETRGKIPFPICQNHTYSLFAESFNKSLNFFLSYSGNTEETISTLKLALEEGLPSIGMACGGEIESICKEKGVPFVKLPLPYPGFQPRMGTGYFVGAILQVLANQGFVSDLGEELIAQTGIFNESMVKFESEGKSLAAKIAGKTPIVWSSQKYKDLARVWTIKFNEHAKNPAFWNFFSELNHNSMVGYTNLGDRYFAIMLKDGDDYVQNLKRYQITADILKDYKMDSVTLDLVGNSVFAKLFNSIYLS